MAIFSTSGAGIFTPEGFADALHEFGESVRPAVKRALNRNAKAVRAIYMAKARKRGVIRSIFGKKPRGLYSLVHTKVVDKGSVFVLALELRGLAAMQESGGRTKAHRVNHPGSNIAVFPVGNSAMNEAAPRIRVAIDTAIAEFKFRGVKIAKSSLVA